MRSADVSSNRGGTKLKVWWIPQVPMSPFEIQVDSFAVAKALLISLAQYDLFQFENKIKPDYCNAGGLMILEEDGEYTDWYSDEGDSIDQIEMEQCWELDRAAAGELKGTAAK